MAEPAISVLVSARNEERYVRQAIVSVLGQTFGDFEIIFVDDASGDGTAEIVESLKDKRIRVFRRLGGCGLAANLNFGLARARGSYIARLDADDFCETNRLKVLHDVMKKDAELAFVGSCANMVDEGGRRIGVLGQPICKEALAGELRRSNCIIHGSVMMCRNALEAVKGYRREFPCSQDYDLWLRLCEQWKGGVISDVLYNWRLRRGAIGSSRRVEQVWFSHLARTLDLERRKNGSETTDLKKAALGVALKPPKLFHAIYQAEQIRWFKTVYAGGGRRAAMKILLGLFARYPGNPNLWSLFWVKYLRLSGGWLKARFVSRGL